MNNLIDDNEWNSLKTKLRNLEKRILSIIVEDNWVMEKELETELKGLLKERRDVLNDMFRLHVGIEETLRFADVNDCLQSLTRKMFKEHASMLKFLSGKSADAIVRGCDVRVESRLDVDEGAKALHFDDDEEYGSNFAWMLDAIALTEDLEIYGCITKLGERPEQDILDDGVSWAEDCLVLPQLIGTKVCYAVHDLCLHKKYSVLDLLRIQSYSIRHTVDVVRVHRV